MMPSRGMGKIKKMASVGNLSLSLSLKSTKLAITPNQDYASVSLTVLKQW